jgi:hypothetical protein
MLPLCILTATDIQRQIGESTESETCVSMKVMNYDEIEKGPKDKYSPKNETN